ncbi:hypothetical protein JHK87_052970 [Glycine soja]|nr:hypothetical protein JHK87_052970 [Glycine soja]
MANPKVLVFFASVTGDGGSGKDPLDGGDSVSPPSPAKVSFRNKTMVNKEKPVSRPHIDLLKENLTKIEYEDDNPLKPKVVGSSKGISGEAPRIPVQPPSQGGTSSGQTSAATPQGVPPTSSSITNSINAHSMANHDKTIVTANQQLSKENVTQPGEPVNGEWLVVRRKNHKNQVEKKQKDFVFKGLQGFFFNLFKNQIQSANQEAYLSNHGHVIANLNANNEKKILPEVISKSKHPRKDIDTPIVQMLKNASLAKQKVWKKCHVGMAVAIVGPSTSKSPNVNNVDHEGTLAMDIQQPSLGNVEELNTQKEFIDNAMLSFFLSTRGHFGGIWVLSNQSDATCNLVDIKEESIQFSSHVFGNIFKNQRKLEAQIKGVHCELDVMQTSSLIALERDLRE